MPQMKPGRKIMGYVAAALVVYALFVTALYAGQRSLLYHPDQTVPDPAAWGVPEITALRIETADGYRLLAWWRPARATDKPVIAYFHGNAGHIGERAEKVRAYLDAGYGVLLLTYRYNAGAGGKPGEQALYTDARAALEFLDREGVDPARLVLYGESLGSGVAVTMATERPVAALVLEAPYSNMAELAQSHYWYTPARWLVKDRFDSVSRIAQVNAPLLVVHGERDRLIPPRFARALLAAAKEPKTAVFLPRGQHNDLLDYGLDRIVIEFLEKTVR